jgi:hypothetical protein
VVKRPALSLALLFLFLLATRLCHSGIIWVEEAYPATAAIQMLSGKTIYRDFWFDKPPLTPLLYLLWGAQTGPFLRLAGAVFLFACCLMAWRFARDLWTGTEGLIAAALLAFFVTFEVPSAAMALAPDLVMLLPHLAAVYLASRNKPLASGLVAGLAMLVNPKGVFVLAACLPWCWRTMLPLIAAFAVVNAAGLLAMAATGTLCGYYEQVWAWGSLYSRDTFVDQPLVEGLRRTAAWLGFHSAIVIPAAWYAIRERSPESRRFLIWSALALAGVVLGWRFFPRYYFLLLPPVALAAARGFTLVPSRARALMALLLLIPLVRFGPRYAILGADLVRGRQTPWADLAMNQDSRDVSDVLHQGKAPHDTLLVWGYRPDIFLYTRMPAGTPFLDSQPLTGVIADRHLTRSDASVPELARENRQRLAGFRPTFIVDGLGGYNPKLAITKYPDLAPWLAHYREVARTAHSVVFRLR